MDASAFRNKTNLTQRNRRALPFVAAEDGSAPGEAVECFNPNSAVMACQSAFLQSQLRRRARLQRMGDPSTGDFGDAKVIRKFGDVPDDLSAL
jgi:hypothetical protein